MSLDNVSIGARARSHGLHTSLCRLPMTTSLSNANDKAVRWERNLLGALLESPERWHEASSLSVDHFLLTDHKKIFSGIARLNARNLQADMGSVIAELGSSVPASSVAGLVDGVLTPSLPQYVRMVRSATRERELTHLFERALNLNELPEILPQIKRAIEELADKAGNELIVIRGNEAAEKPLRWMWKPYLPKGKLVHFGGNSSQAKSPVTVDIAARTSSGANWPDGTANVTGPRSVIMLNVEDDLEDTILPRFRLAGGDKSRLFHVKGTRAVDASERGVILTEDMQKLSDLAQSLRDLGLIVIDPITNYLGSSKMNAEEQMRAILTPLASLAAKLDIVVITVGHFNRREKGTDPLHRIMGAAAFTGVARAVYTFGPDPDEESKFCHVMTVARGCGGEGSALRYRTELVEENCPDSFQTEIIRVVWTGKSEATAEDSVDPTPLREKAQEDEAAELLHGLLREGRRPAKECAELLKADGYDLDRLNAGRVRRKARAESKKFPGDRFNSWYLPPTT
jgi:hypothetical protein